MPLFNKEIIKGEIKELVRRSVKEVLIHMYLAGVSVVEDITEALWGSKVSASTISELNKKAYGEPGWLIAARSQRFKGKSGQPPLIPCDPPT